MQQSREDLGFLVSVSISQVDMQANGANWRDDSLLGRGFCLSIITVALLLLLLLDWLAVKLFG